MAMQGRYCIFFLVVVLSFILETQFRVRAQYDHASYFSSIADYRKLNDSLKLSRKLGEGLETSASKKTFKVDDFRPNDDRNNDPKAFFMAKWGEACSHSSGPGIMVVPERNYLLKPIKFQGPCKSPVRVQIKGTLKASADRSDYANSTWVVFDGVKDLIVEGGGILNGNGNAWWNNSCKVDKTRPCTKAPTALTFHRCDNLKVSNLRIQDAQQIQVSFDHCNGVQASGLTVTAPGDSPNTDGIHVTHSQHVQITDSVIRTGDDCISIETETRNLLAMGITCGPGHGISIGSLGDHNSKANVFDVTIKGAKLSGTTNGVRIKTYQGGSGSASNITFKDIEMDNVENPIIIDQYYCDEHKPCKEQKSAVQVNNVLYQNIKGTSASEVAIKFDCSKSFPCRGIKLEDVKIEAANGSAKAECKNVTPLFTGNVFPRCH